MSEPKRLTDAEVEQAWNDLVCGGDMVVALWPWDVTVDLLTEVRQMRPLWSAACAVLDGHEKFVGPCAHGRDPWTRCDECGEGDAVDALLKCDAAIRSAIPEDFLHAARDTAEAVRLLVEWAKANESARKASEERARRAEQAKDGAYRERDQIVALLARLAVAIGWRAGLRRHEPDPDPTWDEDWKNVVAIDLPTGQVTWHFHDSERDLFHSLPPYPATWDGHGTAEKYRRVNAYLAAPPPAATETPEGASHE